MLRLLRIKNFAIIDSLELELESGFNVITGETGAGKSIILDAVSLVLGARANQEIIRTGKDEATVEALFETDTTELIIKRSVHRNGKNRIFINGELATLSELTNVCENLVEICSQHEHQSLAKPAYQRELLDSYGGLFEKRKEVEKDFQALKDAQTELNRLLGLDSAQARTEDFMRYQLTEIQDFGSLDDEESLLAERKRLMNGAQLGEAVGAALQYIEQSDGGDARSLLGRAIQRITKMLEADESLKPALEALSRAQVEVEEAGYLLNSYAENIEVNSSRLDEIEERLMKWSLMKKKYGATAEAIQSYAAQLEKELLEFETKNERAKVLEADIARVKEQYSKHAQELSKKRKAVSKTLSKSIQSELAELSMPNTTFQIEFTETEPHVDGIDKIQFLFSPNPGEELKPVGRVASGGELSRLILSIRRTIADRGLIGVYLFDEIDAGIGGQTASVVGRKLKSVAKFNQVMCITHMPQVAAFADKHFHVSKMVEGGRTNSIIEEINGTKRTEEIARMLGGMQVTAKSRAHANDLIKDAKSLV